jgi:hypothetical protein
MKQLNLFVFNQSWFHLGSLVENIIEHSHKFQMINLYYINKGLYVKPLDMSHSFFGSSFFGDPPQEICQLFLKKYFSHSSTKFIFQDVDLTEVNSQSNIPRSLKNFDQLQRLIYEDTSLGLAISSFLITLSKDSQPQVKKYFKLINNLSLTYLQLFGYLKSLNLNKNSDEVWICNGRPFHDRAIVEFCRKNSIHHKFYELGGESLNQKRWILHDTSPHDRVKHQKEIESFYHVQQITEQTTSNWFARQKTGSDNIFAKNFENSSDLDLSNNFFVFFSSSDDEVSAISLDWISAWGNQLLAVKNLIDFFEKNPSLNLVIRVHPNQKNKSRRDKKNWKSLKSKAKNIYIYNFDSEVNSYDLLEQSIGVFTYGSTVGVEAAYLRKPAALMSHSRWDEIIPHRYLKNFSELTEWIYQVSSGQINSLELESAYTGSLMWAHYMSSAGSIWKVVEVKKDFMGRSIGYLDSKSLKPNYLIIALTRFTRLLRLHLIEKAFNLERKAKRVHKNGNLS